MITDLIKNHLLSFQSPLLPRGVSLSNPLLAVEAQGEVLHLQLTVGFPCELIREALAEALATHLTACCQQTIRVDLQSRIQSHVVAGQGSPLPGIKNVLAIASGKGGVGKSTTAVNLALALKALGARVGICDADIYGPSIPMMLGATEKPLSRDNKLIPVMAHGVASMSIGYLIDNETPMVWRGPMVSGALIQLLQDTVWGDLDYLIIDLPPGTGDIQLTLTQKIPVTAAIVVTTPQPIAVLDAKKAIGMFQKVRVPVLGIVENMAMHFCDHCGHESTIFGEGGALTLSKDYDLPILGQLPLEMRIRAEMDAGNPTVIASPESPITQRYIDIALTSAARLAEFDLLFQHRFPTIQIKQE